MITRQLTKRPAPEDHARPGAADPYHGDTYLTDGVNLYWLAGWLARPGEAAIAELEDCRSLHSTLLEREALLALHLVPVHRAG